MSLQWHNRSSRDYLLQDIFGPLQSCQIPLPSMMVLALAQADLGRAVASAAVAELVSQKLCWCSGTA